MITPNPPPPQPQPSPSWAVIEGQLLSGGMPAYRCALRIVYDMCQTMAAQMQQLQQATNGGRWTLPGSIPATGVIHASTLVDDDDDAPDPFERLSGEES